MYFCPNAEQDVFFFLRKGGAASLFAAGFAFEGGVLGSYLLRKGTGQM